MCADAEEETDAAAAADDDDDDDRLTRDADWPLLRSRRAEGERASCTFSATRRLFSSIELRTLSMSTWLMHNQFREHSNHSGGREFRRIAGCLETNYQRET
jgi:hypothetical protein